MNRRILADIDTHKTDSLVTLQLSQSKQLSIKPTKFCDEYYAFHF